MKALALQLANAFSVVWRIAPQRFRHLLIKGLFVLESRGADAQRGLSSLFALQDALEHVINERAMVYGMGEHPKHRLTKYHDFFIDHVVDGDRVLDIGCGYGAVARSVARARPGSQVTGLDYDNGRLTQARRSDNPLNLSFVETDATKSVPVGPWDVVILSNVLEHITNRSGFLATLIAKTGAKRFLIRVPLFERDWKMPLRRAVGANYYSDPDHKIEHSQAEFRAEITTAGLAVHELSTSWGEIWADCRVQDEAAST